MKLKSGAMVVGLLSLLAASVAGADDGYPMSGQDTVLKLNGRSSLTLVDKDGKDLTLNDGGKYRFRLSNKSKSFHIMAGNGHRQEFKVANGFPGGDLDNLSLKGELWGNPGITFSKRSYTAELGAREQVETSGCTFSCGTDYVCHYVPRRECRTSERRVCETRERRVCTGPAGHEVCRTRPETVCHNVPDTVCRDYSERVCGYETRYCSGTETYTNRYTTTEDRQDFSLTDEASNEELGLFRHVDGVHTQTYRVNTLESCH